MSLRSTFSLHEEEEDTVSTQDTLHAGPQAGADSHSNSTPAFGSPAASDRRVYTAHLLYCPPSNAAGQRFIVSTLFRTQLHTLAR